MLGWVLSTIGVVYVCNVVSERNYYKREYESLLLTSQNHRKLLSGYDYINKYAKSLGYKGAVDFFYYLTNNHDKRFGHFARFLNKVRCIRNDVAHNGAQYDIDRNFIDHIGVCVKICNAFKQLPKNKVLYLG